MTVLSCGRIVYLAPDAVSTTTADGAVFVSVLFMPSGVCGTPAMSELRISADMYVEHADRVAHCKPGIATWKKPGAVPHAAAGAAGIHAGLLAVLIIFGGIPTPVRVLAIAVTAPLLAFGVWMAWDAAKCWGQCVLPGSDMSQLKEGMVGEFLFMAALTFAPVLLMSGNVDAVKAGLPVSVLATIAVCGVFGLVECLIRTRQARNGHGVSG